MGLPRKPFELRVELNDGKILNFSGVEEYVSGFKYLYIRTREKTVSFRRDDLSRAERRPQGGSYWSAVPMRNPKRVAAALLLLSFSYFAAPVNAQVIPPTTEETPWDHVLNLPAKPTASGALPRDQNNNVQNNQICGTGAGSVTGPVAALFDPKNNPLKLSEWKHTISTRNPAKFPPVSYDPFTVDHISWYEKEIHDAEEISLDGFLVKYDHFPLEGKSSPELQLLLSIDSELKFGLAIDPAVLKAEGNPLGRDLDLSTWNDRRYIYGMIRDFYATVPRDRWLRAGNGGSETPVIYFPEPEGFTVQIPTAFTAGNELDDIFEYYFRLDPNTYYTAGWGGGSTLDAQTISPGTLNTDREATYNTSWGNISNTKDLYIIDSWNDYQRKTDINDSLESGKTLLQKTADGILDNCALTESWAIQGNYIFPGVSDLEFPASGSGDAYLLMKNTGTRNWGALAGHQLESQGTLGSDQDPVALPRPIIRPEEYTTFRIPYKVGRLISGGQSFHWDMVSRNTLGVSTPFGGATYVSGASIVAAPAQPTPTPEISIPSPTPYGPEIEGDGSTISCPGLWVERHSDFVKIPDIPGTPVKTEAYIIPRLDFEKDETRYFCTNIKRAPNRTISKIEFSAVELHNFIGCAGILLTATDRSTGLTLYSKDPLGGTFNRSTKIILRGDQIQEGVWDLALTDKSILGDHNKDGVVIADRQRVDGGDQCTLFSLRVLIYYVY